MIVPTCQICGTTLNLKDGSSIEAAIRRGSQDDDPDVPREYWEWNQELLFDFCGEEHLKSWMTSLALPTYEPPTELGKTSPFEALGIAAIVGVVLVVLTGAVFGFLLLLERTF